MTLKLVETDNIKELPRYNPRLIPSIARTFADKVEAGDFGEATRCVVIVETDEGLERLYWGEEVTHIEAVGILQMALTDAAHKALDSYDEDD